MLRHGAQIVTDIQASFTLGMAPMKWSVGLENRISQHLVHMAMVYCVFTTICSILHCSKSCSKTTLSHIEPAERYCDVLLHTKELQNAPLDLLQAVMVLQRVGCYRLASQSKHVSLPEAFDAEVLRNLELAEPYTNQKVQVLEQGVRGPLVGHPEFLIVLVLVHGLLGPYCSSFPC